jgi:hypothetical protein
MAFDKKTHMESVRESVQRLADLQAAIWKLEFDDVGEAMDEIEAVGATAIARSEIGGECMEIKSGNDKIDFCKGTGIFDGRWAPIPDGYHIWFSMPISTDWLVDLKDPWLWRIFWTLTRDPDKGIFWKGDKDPERHEFDKIIRSLYKTPESRTVKVSGEMKIYGSIPKMAGHLGGGSRSSGLGAFEWKEEPLKKAFNAIDHVSAWDGTLRTHKALYALRRYHPNSAGEIARIWLEERNPLKNVEDVEFPMFLENPDLVGFVEANLPLDDAKWKNWHITRWDLTDSVADMWKLSPELQAAYPTVDEWFQGVNIGKGWQELLRQVRTILDRNRLSGRSSGPGMGMMYALKLPQTIRTPEDIANFFAYVYQADYTSFHPDQDFNSILNTQGLPAFQPDEADTRNRLMLEAKAVAQNFNLDIYELMDWVIALIDDDGDPEVENSAPNWMKSLSEWWL